MVGTLYPVLWGQSATGPIPGRSGWGAWATSPAYQGRWATSPERLRRTRAACAVGRGCLGSRG